VGSDAAVVDLLVLDASTDAFVPPESLHSAHGPAKAGHYARRSAQDLRPNLRATTAC
jgi:hypothetical protein